MRPLTGVLCAGRGTFKLDGVNIIFDILLKNNNLIELFYSGTARMRERPIIDLVDGLKQVLLYVFMYLNFLPQYSAINHS